MRNKVIRYFALVVALLAMVAVVSAESRPVQDSAKHVLEEATAVNRGVGVVSEPKDATGEEIYLIRLADAPLASYRGGVEGLQATNPTVRNERKLDANSPASIAYRDYLLSRQAAFMTAAGQELGRDLEAVYQYYAANNGLAIRMTPAEAARVATMEGVVFVQRDFERELHTDAGPEWIGAESIWDGTATAGEPGTSGEGIIVGVIDTGINPSNPSFADIGGDGYDHTNPWGAGTYVGVCDSGDPSYDPTFPCNDKLIGAWGYATVNGGDPRDYDGHGSHTASTAAGNWVLTATVEGPTLTITRTIKGVAPHANIVAYAACCTGSALSAAIDQVVIDAVDVVNYSIGSSAASDIWNDFDTVGYLNARDAGIFVATSAGNNGPGSETVGSPADAPWLLSVGASTHNRALLNSVIDMTGGDTTPPADILGKSFSDGYGPAEIVYAGDHGNNLCGLGNIGDFDSPWPPGYFNGEIVVCDRGTFGRVEKGANVLFSGAGGMILANDSGSGNSLNGDAHHLPAVHITYNDGVVLKAWLASGAGHEGTITGLNLNEDASNGDIMAGFSSRGANRALPEIIVPSISAPGVDVMAAYGTDDETSWNFISGTSMASPHAAGAAALVMAVHPNWTPAQVQSALMTTAWTDVLDTDGVTPASPFDMGSGRVDLTRAAEAGLVLDETTANYWAADPSTGGDPKTLNLASMGNGQCLSSCSWTRVVSSTLTVPMTWTVSTVAEAGVNLTVSPTDFTLMPGASQALTITADVSAAPNGIWTFGEVRLDPVAPGVASPPARTTLLDESFDDASFPPAGWSTYKLAGTGLQEWQRVTDIYNSAPASAHRRWSSSSDGFQDDWLVTPALNLDSDAYTLSFHDRGQWMSDYGYSGVLVSTESCDPTDGDFVELLEVDDSLNTTWREVPAIDLSAYDGETVCLAFRYSGTFAHSWWIDDLVVESTEGGGSVMAAHMPVAVIPSSGVLPTEVEVQTRRDAGSHLIEGLQAIEITDLTVEVSGLVQADLTSFELFEDPTNTIPGGFYDDLSQVFWMTMTVPANSLSLIAEITMSESPDLDMAVGFDANSDGLPELAEQVCQSAGGSWNEYCEIDSPAEGVWWVVVMNWEESANAPDAVTLATAVVPESDSGNMWVDGPTAVDELEPFDLRVYWDTPTMMAGDYWYGSFSLGSDPGNPGNIGTIPVRILRHDDDVIKSVSSETGLVAPDDVLTYTITVQPNVTNENLTYWITDTIPTGMTYVPGSASATAGVVSVTGNELTWSGVQEVIERRYEMMTSAQDPDNCAVPLANSGAYLNLQPFGILANPAISGDTIWFSAFSTGDPFNYWGTDYTGINFTDDGFTFFDSTPGAAPWNNQDIPDPSDPNNLLAMFWNDWEVVYDAGTNRGVSLATIGGATGGAIIEYDDVQIFGDPSQTIDFEVFMWRSFDDTPGEYEIMFAFDNINADLDVGTIGLENADGSDGVKFAYDDAPLATLTDGMAICFDWFMPSADPTLITYQVTVDSDAVPATVLTNEALHDTSNLGSMEESTSTSVTVYGYNVELSGDMAASGAPGSTITYTVQVTNSGTESDTFDVSVSSVWSTSASSSSIVLNAGQSGEVVVTVEIPTAAADGDSDTATVTVTSQADANATASVDLTTTAVVEEYKLYMPILFKP